jgi:UDP-2-acetamido-3-amino-2,3-dideoxy-glucuronate N-acetyltransferase
VALGWEAPAESRDRPGGGGAREPRGTRRYGCSEYIIALCKVARRFGLARFGAPDYPFGPPAETTGNAAAILRNNASGVVNVSNEFFVHSTAVVDPPCSIGAGTKIWHFSHVMRDSKLGRGCILGQNVHVASHVRIGDNVKIQNNVSLYSGCEIEDDVFLGPSCVFTNVRNPRSQIIRHDQYEPTIVRRGASIGANATIVCGATIGRYAFIAAGAVITKDVPDYALMMGAPARVSGWMSRHGYRLDGRDATGILRCPVTGLRYRFEADGALRCLDLDEEAPLPCSTKAG